MDIVNSDGDMTSDQTQMNCTQSIENGTEVDEIKGYDTSLNMEKITPENKHEQTEINEILPQIAITESNISSAEVPLSRIYDKSAPSINKSNDNNVRPEITEMDAVAENNPSESEPIALHTSIQNFKEKGAIPKRDIGKSLHKTEQMVDKIRKGRSKIKVDTDQKEQDIQCDLNKSASSHPDNGNVKDNNVADKIDEEIDIYIHVQKKNKEEKNVIIKTVMKYICACLNSNGGIVKLKNKHWKRSTQKDLDVWYNYLETQLFDDSSKFIELEGKYNDELLFLRIRPLNYIFTVDMYLYFPRTTDIVKVRYNQAIDILHTYDKSGSLTELPAVEEVFEYQKSLLTLMESDQIQFKEIKSSKVLSKFSSEVNKYISAFCNHKGGRIFFGIEDKEFKVVGVPLTELDKDSITRIIYAKMDKTMKWGCDNKTYVYGIHWSIDFQPVNIPDNIKVTIQEGASLEVIIVSVCRYPGGVFTDTPNAYYIREEDRTIQQFTFKDWKTKMISSHKGIPFTKGCGEILQASVYNLFDDVSDTNKTVHQTQRGVLNITEMLSDTASNVSVLKDLVESGSLSSEKQKRSRGTEVLQDENCENFQVPSNLFEHHVTHDYKSTRNDTILQNMLENHNCVTVKGYIGTGKSQLALNYGLTMKKDNNLVWKFDCSNIRELWRSTAYLLKELQYKIKDTENKKDDILFMARTINEYLEKNYTSLHILIFEDVSDDSKNVIETFINVYLAKRGNLKVLVTSFLSVTEIELEIYGFSEEEAISFIDAIAATDAEREELVKTFSCNPLGLKIALRYITHCQISVRAFLGKLSLPTGALDIENSPAISQQCELKPLFQSLHLILSDIHQKNPRTLEQILLTQFLGSDNIPVIMLENVRLNFGSHELKQEGICNSTSDTIDDVIFTLKQYSFARISGKDDTRVLHTHSAILLAIKNYTSEAVESNNLTVADMLKALLWTVVCLMHKDNRMEADLERHTYLLPYAESILNHTRTLLCNTEEAKTKLFKDISFSLPLVYVSDIVGYTYDFDEMFHFGEAYYKVAESYLMKMVEMSVPIFCATDEDIQIKSMEQAKQLNRTMNNIYKQNTKMLNTIGQWYILNKYRPKEELEIIQKGLQRAGKILNGKLKNEQNLDLLHENKLAVPKKKIGYFFFFEVVISFLYSYGRRLFKTMPLDTRHNFYFLHIADHLSNIVHTLNPQWKMIHHLLTKRSGTLQVALKEISGLPQTSLKDLKEIAKQCLLSLDERQTYFRFGIIYLETESDEFNKVIWLKQLVRCYKTMIRKAKNETEKEEIKQEGQEHVEHLEKLIKAFEHTSALPSLLLCIGEFYQCIRDFQNAKTTFKKLFPKLTQVGQKVKPRKHERKSYIYYLQCLLLEPKDTRLEDIESEACKDIDILVPRCYKVLMNHDELKDLEELLFMSEQDSIMKHEQRACFVYLDSRLSHLQNGGLDEDVYTRHVMEITELLDKYSKMPLNHTKSGLGDMEMKLSDLRKKHNS